MDRQGCDLDGAGQTRHAWRSAAERLSAAGRRVVTEVLRMSSWNQLVLDRIRTPLGITRVITQPLRHSAFVCPWATAPPLGGAGRFAILDKPLDQGARILFLGEQDGRAEYCRLGVRMNRRVDG